MSKITEKEINRVNEIKKELLTIDDFFMQYSKAGIGLSGDSVEYVLSVRMVVQQPLQIVNGKYSQVSSYSEEVKPFGDINFYTFISYLKERERLLREEYYTYIVKEESE